MLVQSNRKYYHTRHQVQVQQGLYGPRPRPTFMGLPPEIREMIYIPVLSGLKLQSCSTQICYPKVLASSSESDKKSLAILCVNKQVNLEACRHLLRECDLYFLNQEFHVFHERHVHKRHVNSVPRPRLSKDMYQEIRTIWITTAHVRSWDHYAGLKSLGCLRLINIEHEMKDDDSKHLLTHLTCKQNYDRDPKSIVVGEDLGSLIGLTADEIVGLDSDSENERAIPKLRPVVAKDDRMQTSSEFTSTSDSHLAELASLQPTKSWAPCSSYNHKDNGT